MKITFTSFFCIHIFLTIKYHILAVAIFNISQTGIIDIDRNKQIMNSANVRAVRPKIAPAGVKIKKININNVTRAEIFINLLSKIRLLKTVPSNLILKQWKICEKPNVANAIVIALEVSLKSFPKAKAIRVIIVMKTH